MRVRRGGKNLCEEVGESGEKKEFVGEELRRNQLKSFGINIYAGNSLVFRGSKFCVSLTGGGRGGGGGVLVGERGIGGRLLPPAES